MWCRTLTLIVLAAGSVSFAEETNRLAATVTVERDGAAVKMTLTGFANRKLLGRNVYLISSYCAQFEELETPADVLAFAGPKQLRIRMLCDLPSNVVATMIRRSFDAYDDQKQLTEEIRRIDDYLRDHRFRTGDEIILTTLDGTGLSCRVNSDEPEMVSNPALPRVVWSIYFGNPAYHGPYMPRQLTRRIAPRAATLPESKAP